MYFPKSALSSWLRVELPRVCEAAPEGDDNPLVEYIIAMVSKEEAIDVLKEEAKNNLAEFTMEKTNNFVEQLFSFLMTIQNTSTPSLHGRSDSVLSSSFSRLGSAVINDNVNSHITTESANSSIEQFGQVVENQFDDFQENSYHREKSNHKDRTRDSRHRNRSRERLRRSRSPRRRTSRDRRSRSPRQARRRSRTPVRVHEASNYPRVQPFVPVTNGYSQYVQVPQLVMPILPPTGLHYPSNHINPPVNINGSEYDPERAAYDGSTVSQGNNNVRNSMKKDAIRATKTICLRNVPSSCLDESILRNFLTRFGLITRLTINQESKRVFVLFADEIGFESAVRCGNVMMDSVLVPVQPAFYDLVAEKKSKFIPQLNREHREFHNSRPTLEKGTYEPQEEVSQVKEIRPVPAISIAAIVKAESQVVELELKHSEISNKLQEHRKLLETLQKNSKIDVTEKIKMMSRINDLMEPLSKQLKSVNVTLQATKDIVSKGRESMSHLDTNAVSTDYSGIIVKLIPLELCIESQLRTHFEQFGIITSIVLSASVGVCIIKFDSTDSAKNALNNGKIYCDRTVLIEPYISKRKENQSDISSRQQSIKFYDDDDEDQDDNDKGWKR